VFLGKYYSQIYWSEDTRLPLEDTTERWAARLTKHGVHTMNISALRLLRADQGIVSGFAVERITGRSWGAGSVVMNHLFSELEALGDRSAFAYAHLMDIHAPYNAVTKRGSQFSRYLAEVTLVDKQLGRLREFLTEKGLTDRTLLILSADHGEAFHEHGAGHHGNTTYDEVLRVPLCFHATKLPPSQIDVPVTLIDLGPTILDVFGLPSPGHIMGQTLLPLLAGKSFVPRRPIAAEAGRRLQSLVFPDGIKVHRDPIHNTLAVYDLKADPGELNDLNGAPNAPYSRYTAGTAAFFEAIELKRPGYEVPWRKW
jgi:hypothetical protein